MFCKNCGKEVNQNAAVCLNCGFAVGTGNNYCPQCACPTAAGASFCTNCGAPLNSGGGARYTYSTPQDGEIRKSKIAAGLLGILLGLFGAHNFYLGFTAKAIVQLLITLTVLLCPISAIWGLVEGILILVGERPVDARGVPLKD